MLDEKIPAPMAVFIKSHLHVLGAAATAVVPAAADAPSIVLTLRVAASVAARIKPGETIFVYVRDPAV